MYRKLIIVVAALTSLSAAATDTFSARRANALKVERSSIGHGYLELFMPATDKPTTALVAKCFPNGETGTVERVSLVADIGPDGSFLNVEVQPLNPRSKCYADGFSELKAPPPPEQFAKSGFPIAVDTSIDYK